MNRTDRLYAIVEELRAAAPRRRSARELAARFEVSVRTIARDIDALTQAGVPIYADTGRRGGYTLDKAMTLPPLNFTPAEAIAAAVVLDRANGTPFAQAARSAVHKIVAAMSARDATAARDLASRIQLLERPEYEPQPVPSVIQDAIVDRRVLRLTYLDRTGVHTEREVEPVLFATVRGRYWYLVAWCRTRRAERAFRVDRIVRAEATGEPAPAHRAENFRFRTCDLIDRTPVLSP
ncbi:YafY family protein [Kibdelosporangium persicum]|uniref:DNA-binding transcriptional regulator YafY n=1 Tax=Kibdelosporangium persicum TaxID=2698649 RepID=A0ABX2FJB6_9PSEU|nr:WYL domain-containing protein [Kibdelosporangium persicum]NRN70815.1 putative DNA-binding transcriptional regulator YafY [Kibdelosporangium persicum]